MTLVGANVLAYAKAWNEANGRMAVINDILRLWSGMPTRHQVRVLHEQRRVAARIERERATQLAAFAKAGEL